MASKAISRILNRSIENLGRSSFNEDTKTDDSFTTFYFEEADKDRSAIDNSEPIKTECNYSKQKREESFSRRERHIFEDFEKERKFLGIITDVNYSNHTFTANLTCTEDLINRSVVFSIDDLSFEECHLVEVGRRIIYIYGKQYRNGTVTNVSNLYFRNDYNWTEREIERKRNEARALYNLLSNSGAN